MVWLNVVIFHSELAGWGGVVLSLYISLHYLAPASGRGAGRGDAFPPLEWKPHISLVTLFCVNINMSSLLLSVASRQSLIWKAKHLQCRESVTFWCGSGSALLCLWLMEPDPDPTPFFSNFKGAKKLFFCVFFSYFYIIFSLRNLIFCCNYVFAQQLYEKRERSRFGTRSGSIPLTNGSGSRRPKNMRIRITLAPGQDMTQICGRIYKLRYIYFAIFRLSWATSLRTPSATCEKHWRWPTQKILTGTWKSAIIWIKELNLV